MANHSISGIFVILSSYLTLVGFVLYQRNIHTHPNFLVTAQPAPTLGVHPDKSEWFHCTRIHTIVDRVFGLAKAGLRYANR
jgi:hypothetical protein